MTEPSTTREDKLRSFRSGANAIRAALHALQEEHSLTDLEVVSVLNEHQRGILNDLVYQEQTQGGTMSVPVDDHEYDDGYEAAQSGDDYTPAEVAAQSASWQLGYRARSATLPPVTK